MKWQNLYCFSSAEMHLQQMLSLYFLSQDKKELQPLNRCFLRAEKITSVITVGHTPFLLCGIKLPTWETVVSAVFNGCVLSFQGYYDNPKVCALYVMKGTLEGESWAWTHLFSSPSCHYSHFSLPLTVRRNSVSVWMSRHTGQNRVVWFISREGSQLSLTVWLQPVSFSPLCKFWCVVNISGSTLLLCVTVKWSCTCWTLWRRLSTETR